MEALERKQVPVSDVRNADHVDGIVEAIVSVTNIVDNVNDIIVPGAYRSTLKRRNPKGVWSHDTNIPVAKTLRVEELMPGDPRLPADLISQNAGALLVKMQFNLNTSRGRDAFHDVQFFGSEQEWSIGYSVPEGKSETNSKSGIRRINQLELFEYSPVIFGAAPHTRTMSLKNEMENTEAKAIPEDVSVGSTVSFAVPKPPDKTEYAKGVVEKIVRSGEVRLPDTSESMEATTLDPVAIIKVYARMDDDQYEETDRRVIKKISSLRVIDEFRNEEKSVDEEIEEKAPSISASAEKALKQKVADHNEKYGDNPAKKATYAMLAASYRRGIGAYRTNPSSVRPTVSSAEQWAMARVNGLLYALRTGRFRRTAYDTDLLPEAHSLSTRGKSVYTDSPSGTPSSFGTPQRGVHDEEEDEDEEKAIPERYADLDFSIPASVKTEAQRGLDWSKKYNRGGTSVGKNTANYLISNSTADWRKVFHIAAYFNRHEVDLQAPQNRNRSNAGWPGSGLIAWKLWGGNPGRSWSQSLVKSMQLRDEREGYDVVRGPGGRVARVDKKSEHMMMEESEVDSPQEIAEEYTGINERQAYLAHYLEMLVDEFGMFDKTANANGSHYMEENPFNSEGLNCANCIFYEGGKGCHIVSGEIEPTAICKFWIIKDELVGGEKSFEADEQKSEIEFKGGVSPSHSTNVDDTSNWVDYVQFRRMKSPADRSYYQKIFGYQNPETDGTKKTHWTYVHHFVNKDGTPGAASWPALMNTMAVLNGARGGTKLRGEDRKNLYRHMKRHYLDHGKTPPELKSDVELDQIMLTKGLISEPLTPKEQNDGN